MAAHRSLRTSLNKPQYIYRPRQLLRRLTYREDRWGADDTAFATLPWGHVLECWPTELLGSSVMRTGIYDLAVTEALVRLADEGDQAVDVGANVGHMSSALAHAVGKTGRVTSFEPHPVVAAILRRNLARWHAQESVAALEFREAAVSDRDGTVTLINDSDFAYNRGTSRVVAEVANAHDVYQVQAVRLDRTISSRVGVLKLDAEGHEGAILRGAESLLSAGLIRDIVFEEFDAYPTPVTDALEHAGFVVLGVLQRLRGPEFVEPARARDALWDPPAMVATRDVERARARFAPRGWRALRSGQRRPSRGR